MEMLNPFIASIEASWSLNRLFSLIEMKMRFRVIGSANEAAIGCEAISR